MEYNDLQFHILGHYMGCSAEYMRFQLVTYIQTYLKGVKIVGEGLLKAKGLAVEDFIGHISQPNNRGDKLSLYLLSRMVQKQLCVIGCDTIWHTSYSEAGTINVEDCHIILVYLGGGDTVRDTKLISHGKPLPPSLKHKNVSGGDEYEPEGKVVYNLDIKKGALDP